ncbi:hypothetical protein FB45DRAFT_64858 [Roridomyces roridus]|uniref:Uncharacterized protein n=1 Tax=Roridomyces roridus TaxID=1738132 RepID=A0AAD7AYB7_9AGAR|nr:hypothetical protein FB45DRAFT_64858 [Roridomyces roridus]
MTARGSAQRLLCCYRLWQPGRGPCAHSAILLNSTSSSPTPTLPNDSDEEKDDVKLCNCSQSCGRALTERTRRQHYSKGDPLGRRPSVTIPRRGRSKRVTGTTAGSSDDVDKLNAHDNSGDDARTSDDNGYSVDAMAVDLDPRSPSPFLEDVGMDVDDEDLLLSDVELLDLGEEDEWLQFDPGQEVEEIQTREEMERELEEMLTPAEEAALWETRQGNDILTERDCDNLRAFQLKMICSMPMLVFAQMILRLPPETRD